MSDNGKPQFYINLPTERKKTTQVCELCLKEYQTQHKQQRYCNDPCMPLTATQKRKGITDEIRRSGEEAVAEVEKAGSKRRWGDESLGELSRKWLSMSL